MPLSLLMKKESDHSRHTAQFGLHRECTVQYCTVLHCTVLYCTVLYSTVRSVIIGVKEHFSHTTSKMSFIILLWGKISTKISERLLLHIITYWIIILFRMFCFYFTYSSPFNSSFCISSGTEDPWTWKIVEKYVPFIFPSSSE